MPHNDLTQRQNSGYRRGGSFDFSRAAVTTSLIAWTTVAGLNRWISRPAPQL